MSAGLANTNLMSRFSISSRSSAQARTNGSEVATVMRQPVDGDRQDAEALGVRVGHRLR